MSEHTWPPWRMLDEYPRLHEAVLVTYVDTDGDPQPLVDLAQWNPAREFWTLVGGSGLLENVVAWMPTPPPYGEED